MKNKLFPYDLQFFADDPGESGETSEGETGTETKETGTEENEKPAESSELTVEQLKAELAKERAARQRDKIALDKVLKENGDVKKQLRAKQTAQEVEEEAKREESEAQKAYVAELEEYKHKNEAKERYLLQGMDAETAKKAAEAEVNGDMDELASIQKKYMETKIKEKEAEWKKSRPQLNAGEGGSSMTKEEIMAIKDTAERQKAIAANLGAFK